MSLFITFQLCFYSSFSTSFLLLHLLLTFILQHWSHISGHLSTTLMPIIIIFPSLLYFLILHSNIIATSLPSAFLFVFGVDSPTTCIVMCAMFLFCTLPVFGSPIVSCYLCCLDLVIDYVFMYICECRCGIFNGWLTCAGHTGLLIWSSVVLRETVTLSHSFSWTWLTWAATNRIGTHRTL